MAISFELPAGLETNLRRMFDDLDQTAKEAALVELYRQQKLTQHELSEALGTSRFETDTLLKRHGVVYDASLEQIRLESASLRSVGHS